MAEGFTVTTNPTRVDILMNADNPHIVVPLWKVTSIESYRIRGIDDEIEHHELIDYCIAYSMEAAIETIKAKYRSWAELDDAMIMVHIRAVEYVSDTVMIEKAVAEAILEGDYT